MSYRLVIQAKLPVVSTNAEGKTIYSEDLKYLVLDTCSERRISASSTIASQPLQSGDVMSDHMYRQPDKYSVSGIFSLNGRNWNDNSYEISNVSLKSADRLTNIEEVFEYIKNNGILCDLVTYEENDEGERNTSSTRFKIRKNMALTSISWTEKQNSIAYSFEFNEVIAVDMIEYDVDVFDPLLPNLSYPRQKSLGSLVTDIGDINRTLIKTLYENGYMTKEFIQQVCKEMSDAEIKDEFWKTFGEYAATIGIGLGIGAGVFATVAVTTAAIFPVGTIIVGAVAAVAAIGIGIWSLISKNKNKTSNKEAAKSIFKVENGSIENGKKKLEQLAFKVKTEAAKSLSNISAYEMQVEVGEDGEEKHYDITTLLEISGNYYYLFFKWNNDYNAWICDVSDIDNNPVEEVHTFPICSTINEFSSDTIWFRTNDLNYNVYVLNSALSLPENQNQEAQENVRKRLNSCSIWVTKGNVKEIIKNMNETIVNTILNIDYSQLKDE